MSEKSPRTPKIRVVEEESEAVRRRREREGDDTIRHQLTRAASKSQTDLADAVNILRGATASSEDAARALLLEARRTRMASRPGFLPPLLHLVKK